ncbi:centrosomal protein of 152 kDa isoform X3 [Phyllopteryx taeniolatus]|uniref:centrosomal protein of 152 kDa isoform X3 n=1 Tax=Phyllopteryx taeniolatus TaxID=161469 RepID=UPI002AD2829F|nr:centrosomal protein of 152 kDa isoform X3 [Phyllopteryx taeniolatus]
MNWIFSRSGHMFFKWDNMGPLVEDMLGDLKTIQRSLWELKRRMDEMSDDLLEDDEYISSAEEESSTCSNKSTGTSPQSKWTRQQSEHPRPTSNEQRYEADYDQQPHGFASEDGGVQINGHQRPAQTQPPDHMWNQQSQDWQFTQSGAVERHVDDYTANYNPHVPPRQMLSSQTTDQDRPFDQLQRVFLDSTQQTAEKEQLAQLQILNKAHHRQIEDLEKKLEDSKRKSRFLEHQLAVVKDEKNGFAVSLKESSRHQEEAKEREVKLQSKVKVLEQQIQTLIERDQENTKKQRVAEAAVDSMKQQMLELCHSDTLSKAREQHDRDVTVIKEQHEAALLVLQQQLDARSQALDEQMDTSQRFREQVKQLERQREEEQLDRGRVVNALTQRLEEIQQQCAKLLETSSVQEMSKIQIKLQQAQTAKVLNEDMNRVLQEDLADLKEQIMLYESALKHGVIALNANGDCENQLSDSCLALGLKKTTFKNGSLHSMALANLSDSKLPEDEALRQLKVEMQRCLGCLKAKRQKFSHLQEELQKSCAQVKELQTQLDEAKLSLSVRQCSQIKHQNWTGEDQNELVKLKEDKKCLQDQVEVQEKKIIELQQSEEKLRSANLEVRIKMGAMIKEFDQERQEAVERTERIHQQHWDDVVDRVRTELTVEHKAQVEYLTAQHEQDSQHLNTQLSEVNDKLLDVQECYISLCKEKDLLEEKVQNREGENAPRTGKEKREENSTNVENLRAELMAQHQASMTQVKALWSREKEDEIQQQVNSQVALAKAAWEEEHHQKEMTWTLRLEEARREKHSKTSDRTCQTEEVDANGLMITVEDLNSRLCAQRQQLQVEAEKVKHQAVEEAKKQVQKDTQDKHLEDLANKVEGAVTRAYNRWIEDLTSLPEYQASLQREKENWEELQKEYMEQKISEAQLSCVLRETQEQHEREINKMQNSLAQVGGQACSRKECAETTSKMQKKTQELQKHLEKACRQFQHSVWEHKTTMQKLKDEHESRLQKAKEEHLRQLEEVKRSKEAAGTLNHQQNLKEGLEEMKQQYLMTVEEIKGNILRYVHESHERAAEMIRTEVQRERQETARKMRHYYLTCLQQLLEDSGKTTGAEKKIMNAASKLAAMAKVLETPVKKKSGENPSLPTCMTVVSTTGHSLASNTDFLKNPSTLDIRMEDRTHREMMLDMERKTTLVRTKLASKQDIGACESSADAQLYPHKVTSSCLAPLRSKGREVYLQGGQPDNHFHGDPPNKPSLTQEAPVRDDKLTCWYLTSSDSDDLQIPRLSYSERKVELAKAFSDLSEFGCLTPDASDLTVYNDIAQETKTRTQTFAPKAKMSTHREPTPGSEGQKQRGVCSGPLFSELRQHQQDSGFDSPLNQPK